MKSPPNANAMVDAESQAERLRTAFEELAQLLDARTIRVLREAASDPRSWSKAVQDPRAYLAEAGVEVSADTEVNLLVPAGAISAFRPAVELACYPITKYEWGCKNLVTVKKPIMGPGGQPIDYIEVTVCVEWGLIPVQEWYCRSRPWLQSFIEH